MTSFATRLARATALALALLSPAIAEAAGAAAGAVTGFDSGAVTAQKTPANASHTAGQSVGGLFTIQIGRFVGGSGIVTSVLLKDTNGAAQTYVLRVWQQNPSNTTCTDNANFVGSNTDDTALIGGGPISITTAAPASTQGDSAVYAALTNLTWDYKIGDVATQNLYACLVTTGTYTPASSKTMYLSLSGPQN